MGALRDRYLLDWRLKLAEGGYSCWELVDNYGVRWGWAVNASHTGWTAHTGDWGQAADVGRLAPLEEEKILQFDTAADAKSWIEEEVALAWKEAR